MVMKGCASWVWLHFGSILVAFYFVTLATPVSLQCMVQWATPKDEPKKDEEGANKGGAAAATPAQATVGKTLTVSA